MHRERHRHFHQGSIPPPGSIPPSIREGRTMRFGGGGLGSLRTVRAQRREREEGWLVEEEYVGGKTKRAQREPSGVYDIHRKPVLEEVFIEVMENYDEEGRLGAFFDFAGTGIDLSRSTFKKHKDIGDGNVGFSSPGDYEGKRVSVTISTIGDIVEVSVVPSKQDLDLFPSSNEFLISELRSYNPASMIVKLRNNLVTVGYSPRVGC